MPVSRLHKTVFQSFAPYSEANFIAQLQAIQPGWVNVYGDTIIGHANALHAGFQLHPESYLLFCQRFQMNERQAFLIPKSGIL